MLPLWSKLGVIICGENKALKVCYVDDFGTSLPHPSLGLNVCGDERGPYWSPVSRLESRDRVDAVA